MGVKIMSFFDHIDNQIIRELCEGKLSPDSGYLPYALGFTAACLAHDEGNADISFETLDARQGALSEAGIAFQSGDLANCVSALRRAWLV
jgi:hypothetical protein